MKTTLDIADCDVIFLSYDEPNADENYQNLVKLIPWAQRVHGVEGSDAAHKACANLADTDRFVVVDGDNFMTKQGFLNQKFEITDDSIDLSKSVISWPSVNTINGLVYGNGGIKCWDKNVVLNMRTHESAPVDNIKAQVDFCWDIKYIPLDVCYSEIRNNASAHQAWRAGFREGVKMSLDEGLKANELSKIWKGNLNRMLIWMTVGADADHGLWSILGARQGCYMTNCTDWDYTQVRDFTYLNSLWDNEMANLSSTQVISVIKKYGEDLKDQLVIPEYFTVDQSRFFKRFNFNPLRQSDSVTIKH